MKLFGKKPIGLARDSEEEFEEEIDDTRKLRKKTPKDKQSLAGYTGKEFKDLKGENKKKRKEPPKPWGKRERLLVLFAVFLTAGTSGVLSLSSRNWKLPGLPRIQAPQFSMPLLGEKTIVIEGNKDDQVKGEEVKDEFQVKTKNLSGVYGLFVVRLKNGSSYGLFENEIFKAASLIKLPVIAAAYIEADAGRLDLDEAYVLKKGDKISGSGSLTSKPEGYEVTYRELLVLMGKQSDNTAFNVLRKRLGDEKIGKAIDEIGMYDTSLAENTTTPADIGRFFAELWRGNIISDAARDALFDSLTDTIYEDWIVPGIPKNIQVAHKYGREVNVVNDAGIIFADDPFVLVILSEGVAEREADMVFPELANIIYETETED